jgi:cell division protein FtsI (penicillin-binding protein 3)
MSDRRIGLLGLIVVFVFGIGFLRLADLTTVDASSLRGRLAQSRQPITVAAPRGTITDARGLLMAISEPADDISADPLLIKAGDRDRYAAQLAPLLDIPVATLTAQLSENRGFVYLQRLLPEAAAKKVSALNIPGIALTPRTRREYPQDTVASQLLGFSGTDGHGLSGLEYSLDSTLHGTDGKRVLVRGRDAKIVDVQEEQQELPGKSVKLTVDARIQQRAEQALAAVSEQYGAKDATAIVMRPGSGDVLAMASWPKVDANEQASAPLSAKSLQATAFNFEPGSTFKPFTVAGALEEHDITPQTTFVVPPQIQVADQVIKDAEDHGTEDLTVGQILAQSSNVGAIKIGAQLGANNFNKWIHRFGFGAPTGVQVPGEQRGIVIPVKQYSGSSMGNLPIGQGEEVTPMQLATAYSTIANGGVREQPTLVSEISGHPIHRAAGTRVISSTVAAQVRTMLEGTTEAGGTGAALAIKGYSIAGKSGTANKVAPGTNVYSKTLYASSFIGMAPAANPKVVVAVIIDEPSKGGIFGAQVAGPAFKDIMRWTLGYLGVPPS